jgi:hypothetical protein
MFGNKHSMKINYHLIFLFIAIVFIALFYNYIDLLLLSPVGTHIWRQADSASFAWCYWQNGLSFFNPEIMNISYGNGKAVSEFPIIAYITALLYETFGFQHWYQKAIHVFIYFLGLCSLFIIASNRIRNIYTAYFLTIIFFAAPIMVFYGNNYIPDVVALSFCFVGIAAYFKSNNYSSVICTLISVIAFCLAGMLKPTYLIPMLSLCSALLTHALYSKEYSDIRKYRFLMPFIFVLIITFIWILFVKVYNGNNEHVYFLTSIKPIWIKGSEMLSRMYVIKRTITQWANCHFHISTHLLFLVSVAYIPSAFKKGDRLICMITIYLLIGCSLYYFLWFWQFLHHDYYTILIYSLYFFSIFNFIILIEKLYQSKIKKHHLFLVFTVFLILNINHTRNCITNRILNNNSEFGWNEDLWHRDFIPYLHKMNITNKDIIISIPDKSPQVSLYMIGCRGYTEFTVGHYNIENIINFRERGAKYLFISGDYERYIQVGESVGKKIGQFNSIHIYKL